MNLKVFNLNYKYLPRLVVINGLKSWTGAIQYDGFKYYPRNPEEFSDPPIEPTKLLMVRRVKPFKGNAYWLKRILCDFKLNGRLNEIVIVKNIPEVNARLYKIKHLVEITPIKTPDGIPNDPSMGHLQQDGVFVVSKDISGTTERIQLTQDFQTDPSRLDADTLKKQSRLQWLNPW